MQRHLYSTINLVHVWIIVFASYRQTMSFLDLVIFLSLYVVLCLVSAMFVKLLTKCHKGTEIPPQKFRYAMPSVLMTALVLSVLSVFMPSSYVCFAVLGPVSVVAAVVIGWWSMHTKTKGTKTRKGAARKVSRTPLDRTSQPRRSSVTNHKPEGTLNR